MPKKYANREKIRDDPRWKQGYELAQHMYDLLEELVQSHPEERWVTHNKIRVATSDMLFCLSLAISNDNPENAIYDWMNARKCLFALQAMYMFACKQRFLDVEPDIVLQIDTMLKAYETKIAVLRQESARHEEIDTQARQEDHTPLKDTLKTSTNHGTFTWELHRPTDGCEFIAKFFKTDNLSDALVKASQATDVLIRYELDHKCQIMVRPMGVKITMTSIDTVPDVFYKAAKEIDHTIYGPFRATLHGLF